MKSVIYVKTKNSSFILKDEVILKEHFEVKSILLNKKSLPLYFWSLFKLTLFILTRPHKIDLFFTRFADFHTCLLAFLSKLIGKKLIVVIGGFDVTAIPAYGYGGHVSKIQSKAIKYALNNADYLLPNNDALIENVNNYTDQSCRGGIRYFAPHAKGKIQVVYNGFDLDFWKEVEGPKQREIITVVDVDDYKTFILKGMDDFLSVAKKMNDERFIVCGMTKNFIQSHDIEIPSNVEVFDYIPHHELTLKLQSAKVFTLLSISEGMPNALCEAMLNECIPVVSAVTSMPEIVGESGFVVEKKNVSEIVEKLNLALNADDALGKKARANIFNNYALSKRSETLIKIINNID